MDKVSVVVATYKREQTLERALRSLTEQSYPNVEIVVVDDNASAEWNAKVAAVVAQFEGIVYICNEVNKGSAETRNVGIRAATGKYVTFLDDDDVYLADKVKNQVEFMQENGLDYSITDIKLYYENEELCEERTRSYIQKTDTESLMRYHLMHHIAGTDCMMYTKEYLLQIGGFGKIDMGDEFYLFGKAIEGGGKFGYLPVSDFKAYVHTESTGLSIGQGKIDGENRVYEYIKERYGKLSLADRRYVKMRHYAVLAFAYVRQKRYFKFFASGVMSFLSAPLACTKLLIGVRKHKI